MFEKVIQEVCDASVVDFEESGVDQKTLNDLKDVSFYTYEIYVYLDGIWRGVSQVGQKRGKPEVLREAVLMGEHRLLRLPLYADAATRLGLGRQAINVYLMSLYYTPC